jgi:diguanylate cyclase (GGDEF)-like protein
VNAAIRSALERAAEALEAEVGAIEFDGAIVTTVGFAQGREPTDALIAAFTERAPSVDVDGLGACPTLIVPIEATPAGQLMLVRSGVEGFVRDEASLVRGMARVLGVTLAGLRALENERSMREQTERQIEEKAALLNSLHERQALLERLSLIQRSISQRDALDDLLDAIVQGAAALLGEDVIGLRLIDPEDPDVMVMVAGSGIDRTLMNTTRRASIGDGVAGRSIVEGRLVINEDYQGGSQGTLPEFVAQGLNSAMAAPVREDGRVVGSLIVASRRPGRHYSETEQEVLLAFAEHASIAITDARTVEAKLHQAFHDPLTSLPNRALFLDRLEEALHPRAGSCGTGVMFIDVDRFKVVNDSMGHAAGDALLVEIAHRVRSCLRPEDTAARLGGDEFAIMVPNVATYAGAVSVAERVIRAMRTPFLIEGHDVSVAVSIGVAVSVPGDAASDLLRNADLAMYQAKTSGGAQLRAFEPGMAAMVIDRLQLEADLRLALERNQLRLEYQPIVEMETEHITAFEALIRWRHPTRGPLAPDMFIRLAEESSLITDVGRFVLMEACERAVEWQALSPGVRINVNLSPRQFMSQTLLADVTHALSVTGLRADLLVLEITENMLMEQTQESISRLHDLKKLGVQLAIDDFGTGYSSLSYLRHFPIDILKIDRSFVEGVAEGPEDSAIARAIVTLGRTLNLDVIAEGIEDTAQRDALRAAGCPLGQGYLYSKPMTNIEAVAMLGEAARGPARV